TGHGSLLTNRTEFHLGDVGFSNLLFVTDGGTLADTIGSVGTTGGSDYNVALVSGPDSLWTNIASLYVGDGGSRNQLIVTNGAKVFDFSGAIGYNSNSSPNSNSVVVTGSGSTWSNTSSLTVGGHGSFNQLFVTNGGTVVGGYGYVGADPTSHSN